MKHDSERANYARPASTPSRCACCTAISIQHMNKRIKAILEEECPDAYISISSEVLPLYREFERFSTVCLNTYIGPNVARYVERFDAAMRDAGLTRGVQLMQSSGGMAPVESTAKRPVNLMMSGPVAGLIGGIWAGKMAGFNNVFTLDIGGTSADIGVAANGQLRMRHLLDTKIGDYQAMIPMVDIDAIGHRRRFDRVCRFGRRVSRRAAIGRCRSRAQRVTGAAARTRPLLTPRCC